MTGTDETPVTPAELQTELRSLLQRAHANGVDVRGGWDCLNGDISPNWDVVVTEVRPTDEMSDKRLGHD